MLDTPGHLSDQIAGCIAEAPTYYTLTFDPPPAKHVDEYHEIALRVMDKPQLKALTSTGYYAQPSFQFQLPALSLQHGATGESHSLRALFRMWQKPL